MKRSKTTVTTEFVAIGDVFREGRRRSLRAVHAAMIETYLEIGSILGRKIREEGWSDREIRKLSDWLIRETGSGSVFTAANLEYMLHFHEAWAGRDEIRPLLQELSWSSHQVLLNECESTEQRCRYLEAAAEGGWTRRELEERIVADRLR